MFRRRSEDLRYDGPFLTVVSATIEGPDGDTFEREFLRHPGAVAVVVLDEEGRAVMTRQYRAAPDTLLLEIPAGLLDIEGEDPEAAARRELEEEVGRTAVGDLEHLATYVPSAGMADHEVTIYLSRTSTPCALRPAGPEESAMTIETISLDDVPRLIAEGELTDGKSIVGLLLAAARR
jgi:ADP-ribose pyrophosphatase